MQALRTTTAVPRARRRRSPQRHVRPLDSQMREACRPDSHGCEAHRCDSPVREACARRSHPLGPDTQTRGGG